MTSYNSASQVPWDAYRADIETVRIGNGVTTISGYAFEDCSSLEKITFEGTVPPYIGMDAFDGIHADATITVPPGTRDEYIREMGLTALADRVAEAAVIFTAQGSTVIDLQNPHDLVYQAEDPSQLTGYDFGYIMFFRVGGSGGSTALQAEHGILYDPGAGILTIPASIFGRHNGPGTPALGEYEIRIVFVNAGYQEIDSFVTFTRTDSGGGNKPPEPPKPEQPRPSSRDSGSDGDGDSSYKKPPVADDWLDPEEARPLAAGAKRQNLDYARTFRGDRYGVRGKSWEELKGLRFYHDTVLDGTVQVRTYFGNPALFGEDVRVSGYVSGANAIGVRAHFEKWFSNTIRTVHFDQTGMWESPVKVAVKVDLAGMDTTRLVFYGYDPKASTYRRLAAPACRVDANGYLRFQTEYAGEIIISEGELEKR